MASKIRKLIKKIKEDKTRREMIKQYCEMLHKLARKMMSPSSFFKDANPPEWTL
jgi:hypothetical protein